MTFPFHPHSSGRSPDLLHQFALNLCAALAYSWDGPLYLHSANPFFAAELALRLESFSRTSQVGRLPMLLWADPIPEDLPEVAGLLETFPSESAVLVLSGKQKKTFSRLHAFRNVRGTSPRLSCAAPATFLKETLEWLAARGFRERIWYGIGGSEYRFWSRLACLAERLGREDRADQFRSRARTALLVWGEAASSAILVLILAIRRNR